MPATITAINKEHQIGIKYNQELIISIGKSRYEKSWKNKKILWSKLLAKLQKSVQTPETHAEYMQMTKDEQDRIKDIGGFVGGHLKAGRRKTGSVVARQILTLDLDFAPEDLQAQLTDNLDLACAMALYSTHKHTPKKPRLRLIIPLDREVNPDEYEAIARKVAESVGIDYFDDSTYQPTRLMYWPSNCSDVEPYFWSVDAPILKADDVLATYPDWTDTSYWPESSRMTGIRKKAADKQGDPTEKKGVVGAFCRTYDIPAVIDKFLSDVYTPTVQPDRYTYAQGSTAAGLVIYEGGKFAYSNHSTDPATGQLCNAFDLVRVHKFGDLDEGHENAVGKKRPSYEAMAEFCAEDPETKLTLIQDKHNSAVDDFAEDLPADAEPQDKKKWMLSLELNQDGGLKPSITNAILIMDNDEALKGIRYNDLARGIEVVGTLPWRRKDKYWRDEDLSCLYAWIARKYGVQFAKDKFVMALDVAAGKRRFNPIVDYLNGLPAWDGTERVDTLLIDYLGASDNRYVREVTRKTLIGAVKRIFEPGCKFDNVLVLDGRPGIGKSTLLRKLGGDWFSDSLTLMDTRDKTAAEKLQGIWIMEIGEMQGTRKADVDAIKGFISRQVDEYRAAYGRYVGKYPRTSIMCGTTNSTTGFLRDTTGNRRFWPVLVSGKGTLSVWDMTEETRAQIWAEAISLYECGEDCYLDKQMEKEATKAQRDALEYDEREGKVMAYLDTLLPEDWYEWPIENRIAHFQQADGGLSGAETTIGTELRKMVCSTELWQECFGRSERTMSRQDAWDMANIMARIPGWERTAERQRVPGYGLQRPFIRVEDDQ
jgi:predicted P-loop ATPase